MNYIKVLRQMASCGNAWEPPFEDEEVEALAHAVQVLKRLDDEVEIKRVICNAENKCVDGFNSTKYMDLDVRDRWENIASALQDYLRGER